MNSDTMWIGSMPRTRRGGALVNALAEGVDVIKVNTQARELSMSTDLRVWSVRHLNDLIQGVEYYNLNTSI
jgi:hypothetical protein